MRNQFLQAVLILIFTLLIFFSTPLANSSGSYYSAADLTQSYSLIKLQPNYRPGNSLLTDTVFSFQPWFMYSRDNLRAGKIPLWNPYNGNGAPLIGNYQSAVFSPFSIPYYVLSFRQALMVVAFLKLFSIGLFTYLFLKQLKLDQTAALVGAIAFMFSGYNIVWLGWPMVSTIVVLPSALFFAEKIFARLQLQIINTYVEQPARAIYMPYPIWPMVGFGASLLVGLLGGHPETFYACFIVIASYLVFRSVSLFWLERKYVSSKKLLGKYGGVVLQFAISGALVGGMAALQLLPFAEYILNSPVLGDRSNTGTPKLLADLWPLAFFPDLLGNGTISNNPSHYEPINTVLNVLTNFNEANSIYTGSLVLFLAALSLLFVHRDKFIGLFAGVGLVWSFYAFNIVNFGAVLRFIPTVSIIPVTRIQPIWIFCVCCCAALFVHHLLTSKPKWPARLILVTSAAGIGFTAFGLVGIFFILQEFAPILVPTAAGFLTYVPGHIAWFGLTFGLGVIVVAWFWLRPGYLVRLILAALLLGVIFLQGGYLLKDYNTLTPDQFFYPATPAISKVQQITNGKTFLIISPDTILPDTNIIYKIPMLNNLDAILVNRHMQLYSEIFSGETNVGITGNTKRYTEAGLKMFGVQYIAAPKNIQLLVSSLGDLQAKAKAERPVGEISANRAIVQTFKAEFEQLNKLSVELATFGRRNNCNLNIQLAEATTAKVVAQEDYKCGDITDNGFVTLSFEPLADSKGKEYKLTLSSPDGRGGNAVTAWSKTDLNYPDGSLSAGKDKLPGGLTFNLAYGVPTAFQLMDTTSNFNIYKYKDALSNYFTVDTSVIANSDKDAFSLATDPKFDPYKSVILNPNEPGAEKQPITTAVATNAPPATILSEEADRVQLKVNRSQPGYLVLAKTYYPGWKARVNGVDQPVLRANYAFSAIKVGTGESQVEFYYDPDSFKYGLLIAAVCFLTSLIIIIVVTVFNRRVQASFTASTSVSSSKPQVDLPDEATNPASSLNDKTNDL